jgi:TrmH family RNA methyltransferase
VVEGPTLLAEALAAGTPIEAVFVPAGAPAVPEVRQAWDAGVRVYDLAPGVLERVAETVTPQPVLAIAAMPEVSLDALTGSGPVVVCVDVRDPGNLGTLVRSAEAAGAAGVVCCGGTVDVYNPKCVRASAGALFHLAVVSGGRAEQVLADLAGVGRVCLGAAVGAGDTYTEADLARPLAFVFGNEASGIPADLGPALDGWVHIPIEGRSESLNVGMACAVLCFEAARQRHRVGAARSGS